MAIILLGELIIGIRGTLGGSTFSANKAGAYVKSWAKPKNPNSVKQETVRAVQARLAYAWQGLAAGQRTDWNTFAGTDPEYTENSLGEEIHISGWGYFSRINLRRHFMGLSILEAAPVGAKAVPPDPMTLTGLVLNEPGGGACTCTWDNANGGVDKLAVFDLRFDIFQQGVYPGSRYRFLFTAPSLDAAATFTSEILAAFGDFREGWYGSGRLWNQHDEGLRSTATQLSAVVA